MQLQISNERLNVWSGEGDLAVLNPDIHIYEPIEDETMETQQANYVNIGVVLDSYGNDSGPDPLPNADPHRTMTSPLRLLNK